MIITFARLQRLSRLERPGAIKRWLQRQGVPYVKDAEGNPFTTLHALNERLCGARSEAERPDYSKARERYLALGSRACA